MTAYNSVLNELHTRLSTWKIGFGFGVCTGALVCMLAVALTADETPAAASYGTLPVALLSVWTGIRSYICYRHDRHNASNVENAMNGSNEQKF